MRSRFTNNPTIYTIAGTLIPPTISSRKVDLITTRADHTTISIIALHGTIFVQNHCSIVILLTSSGTWYRMVQLTCELCSIINAPPNEIVKDIATPVTIGTEVTPNMATRRRVTHIPGPSLLAIVSHHTRNVSIALKVPVCSFRPATECTIVRINQNHLIRCQRVNPIISYVTATSINLEWEQCCTLWSMKNTILKAIVVITSPAFDFITTRANLSTVSIVTLHETILCKYHRSVVAFLTSSSTCYRMLQLICKICGIVNTPPNKVVKSFTTPATIGTEVTPNMATRSSVTHIPLPSLLTIGIRSNQANLWLQLSSNSYSKILWSHYLITITIDILEIYCLIRIRTTSRHKVEYTTSCATCEFELRAIGLDIVDINTRGIGDIILNPVSISCWSSAGLIGILRELSTIKQAIAGIAVDIQCLAILNRITSCEHAQRYCEQ